MFFKARTELSLYCLDSDQIIKIRGQDNFDYQRMDIIYSPCIEDLENGICVNKTKEETVDYLKVPEIYIVYNR
jgi:hypothetical protein